MARPDNLVLPSPHPALSRKRERVQLYVRRLGVRSFITSVSERRAVPSAAKLSSASQLLMIASISGHSSSRIEYHAVSRFFPLKMRWL